MPQIRYIRPTPSPVRKFTKGVQMSTVNPSPWACRQCNKAAIAYADGVIWCEDCGHPVTDANKVNLHRGEQRNTSSPAWIPVKT